MHVDQQVSTNFAREGHPLRGSLSEHEEHEEHEKQQHGKQQHEEDNESTRRTRRATSTGSTRSMRRTTGITAGTTSTTTGSRSRKSTARHRHEHEPEHKRQPAAHACRYCAPLPARKKLLRSTAASALSYSAVAPALASEVAQQHCHFLLPYSL